MRIRVLLAATAALLATHASLAHAQRTGDRARLVFTVSGGLVQERGLWSVPSQPVQQDAFTVDNFAISRSIKRTFGAGFSGAYYPGEHVGITADALLLGLGFEDACRLTPPVQSTRNQQICDDIDRRDRSAGAVTLSAGAVFRIYSREPISPFARINAGLLFSNQSPLLTQGFGGDGALLTIYEDSKRTRVSPSLAIGVGTTIPVGRAYHVRWEVRDNIVGVERVTGPTPGPGLEPPHERTYKHLFSLLIGLDVVLERSRGRRY